jgi:hypothetical protein
MVHLPREQFVTATIAIIAILCVIGGYSALSGLTTYSAPVIINMQKDTFLRSDVFDVTAKLNTVTLLSDETLMIYVDAQPAGAVVLKKYLDDNGYQYGTEKKSDVDIISTLQQININLAEYIELSALAPGRHLLEVGLSQGKIATYKEFYVE